MLTLSLCWIDTCLVGMLSGDVLATEGLDLNELDIHAVQCTARKGVHASDLFHGHLNVLFEQFRRVWVHERRTGRGRLLRQTWKAG